MDQDQFLHVVSREEAERRYWAVIDPSPLPAETVSLSEALHRVLAEDVVSAVDVPGFDRSNMDGFAVRAADTYGATEDRPAQLRLNAETITPGKTPAIEVQPGTATAIATGAMLPRGADAVVMVEDTRTVGKELLVTRPVTPGANVSFAGSDIGIGETVLRRGQWLTARETGVLAAIGVDHVPVIRKPRVAILSTGDELVPPGETRPLGKIYDSNAVILADAVHEAGGQPHVLGIVPDSLDSIRARLAEALSCDMVLLSGGTSKGEGDLCYKAVAELGRPGIVVHGVALKPGKPLCLAAVDATDRVIPVVVLPGFPTSAVFTFHEFVAPIIRRYAGRREPTRQTIAARLPVRVTSARGRTEYLLVRLMRSELQVDTPSLLAWPIGKGSGSVTLFSQADGFISIPQNQEYVEADTRVTVHLLDDQLQLADLDVIGSHCVGLDLLLGKLQERGISSKVLFAGSTAGLHAALRGQCDVAGIHLLDEATGQYNRPFVKASARLLPGYRRMQGIIYRKGDSRFEGKTLAEIRRLVLSDRTCIMVNRNRGSGTRILIDKVVLQIGRGQSSQTPPAGYQSEVKSHNAVAAAVAQCRADWGVAIEIAARQQSLGFVPIQEESYDFVIPVDRWGRPAVEAFRTLLAASETRHALRELGFVPAEP